MAMNGFAEKGEPENWDMAVGSVRGFRWWSMTLPFQERPYYVRPSHQNLIWWHTDAYENMYKNPCYQPYIVSSPADPDGAHWGLMPEAAIIQGMHGGVWSPVTPYDNGRYKAACQRRYPYSSNSFGFVEAHSGNVPDPACGCGYWAYWDGLPMGDFDNTVPVLRHSGYYYSGQHQYSLSIPVSGVIEGSGRTIIGEKGFRCQYAKITDVAAGLDLSGMYYNSDVEINYSAFGNTAFHRYGATAGFSSNPEVVQDFPRMMQERTGISPELLTSAVKVAVERIFGTEFRWHAGTARLLQDARKDENYALRDIGE